MHNLTVIGIMHVCVLVNVQYGRECLWFFLNIVYLYIASYLHDFYPQDLEASLSAHVAIAV